MGSQIFSTVSSRKEVLQFFILGRTRQSSIAVFNFVTPFWLAQDSLNLFQTCLRLAKTIRNSQLVITLLDLIILYSFSRDDQDFSALLELFKTLSLIKTAWGSFSGLTDGSKLIQDFLWVFKTLWKFHYTSLRQADVL